MDDLIAIWNLSRIAPPVRRWRLRIGAVLWALRLRHLGLWVAGERDRWFSQTLRTDRMRTPPRR